MFKQRYILNGLLFLKNKPHQKKATITVVRMYEHIGDVNNAIRV